MTIVLSLCVSLCAASEPARKLSAGIGQLSAPIEWMPDPDRGELTYMIQRTRDARLFLTPNECFFPKLGMVAEGAGTIPDIANLNGGHSFAYITQWDADDQVEWGIWLPNAGRVTIHVSTSDCASGQFSVNLSGQEQILSVPQTDDNTLTLSAVLEFNIERSGRHILRITNTGTAPERARLHWVEISGQAVREGAVLRKRWRPAAAHTRFSSSQNPEAVRLWVIEMDAVPGSLDFYAPITTPFGYYGPTWNADGTVNSSFNFSLWSYGRKDAAPPIQEHSHLLAIGHRSATFGTFGHEGTGVKIRDWEPLAGRQGQRQVLALRVEPGQTQSTYFSYFYAVDEKRWRLFGAGRKKNKRKPLTSLTAGSFVEVPGPPPRQRTGPYERRMRYRGWVMDADGRWYGIDRMSAGDVHNETGLTYTDRGITADNWFYLQTGGWTFRKPPSDGEVRAQPFERGGIPYLADDKLHVLKSVPSAIEVTGVERMGDKARVTFNIRNAGTRPEVVVHSGRTEGLTFTDRWAHRTHVERPGEGTNQVVLGIRPAEHPLLIRLYLRNDEGQFWSTQTVLVE
ncbi:MAG: DUF3472 domain-containing protein [Fuerstiella sp.]|nr:DUF3472 domain-containing protein [Fuerstiella sp.]MDG2127960.1 DUF3472 domain-containing protein [Fuerstiella sp.]